MICLFLDTSSSKLKISLIKNKEIIYDKELDSLRDHSTYLAPFIKESLETNNIEVKDIDKIFVGIGPGSFTGTRIAITLAKTLAYAHNITLIPVSSLEEFIYSYDNYDYYVPVIEERKDKLYFAVFDKDKQRLVEDSYGSKEELYEYLNKLTGNILIISDDNYENYNVLPKKIDVLKLTECLESKEGINPHSLKPNYIKKIEVESKL